MATVPDEARLDDHGRDGGRPDDEQPDRAPHRLPGLALRAVLRRLRQARDPHPVTGGAAGTPVTETEGSPEPPDARRKVSDPDGAVSDPDGAVSDPDGAAPVPSDADPVVADPGAEILLPGPPGPEPVRTAARRERRRRRAARRRWALTVPSILAVLVVLAIVGAQLRGDAPARARAAARATSAPAGAHVPNLLLAHVAGNGRIDLAAVVGVTRDGRDGSIVAVPTLIQAETPSLDFQLLADLRALGSTALLQTTVENLLGVRIDATEVFDDARLTDAIAAAGPLTVDLDRATEVGAAGATRTLQPGTQRITGGDAVALLTQRPANDEVDHMVTVQAVFDAWTAALRTRQGTAETNARFPGLRTLVAAAHTSTDFSGVPVDAISSGPGERYQVREDAVAQVMSEAFPDAQLGIGGRRLRTEILNGTGVVGLVPQVAAVVVPAGAEIVTTGNMPGFGQATTRVVYYRDTDRAAATHLLAALGHGTLVKEPSDIQVFDVTIIAGGDFSPPRAG